MPDPQGGDKALDGAPVLGSNGKSGDANIPGTEEILVNLGAHGQTDHAKLLVTGSEKPEEFLPRGRLSAQQVNDVMQIQADFNAVHEGSTNIEQLITFKFNASIGVDGEARKEFLAALQSQSMGLRSGVGRMFDRFRNGNPPQTG